MTEALGQEVVEIMLKEIRDELVNNNKFVTRQTFNSQRGEFAILRDKIRWFFFSDEALIFIENGKRANTKLPVFKSGNEFKLVPRLEAWRAELGITEDEMPDYVLAHAIARNPRERVPIIKPALDRALPKIRTAIRLATARQLEKELATRMRNIYAA